LTFELCTPGGELILGKGSWLGKGSLLVEGASLGDAVAVDMKVVDDDTGFTLEGNLEGDLTGAISIRVAPDEVGTYIIDARVGNISLDGRAKLESEPHLALLWNEGHTQSASVSLFRIRDGVGCRGFWQEGGKTKTWEVLFQLKQQVLGGDNVISLGRRRR
jgi:hypothetical protein